MIRDLFKMRRRLKKQINAIMEKIYSLGNDFQKLRLFVIKYQATLRSRNQCKLNILADTIRLLCSDQKYVQYFTLYYENKQIPKKEKPRGQNPIQDSVICEQKTISEE